MVIGETDLLALEMLAKHPVLFLKIFNYILWLPVQPLGQRHHQNLLRMCYQKGYSTVSRCGGTDPIHRIKLSHKPFSSQDLLRG